MGAATGPLAAEAEGLRGAYAALNRNEIAAMVGAFDAQIEWIEPAEYLGAGMYRGRAELQEHLSRMRAMWAEGGCEPARLVVAGNKIVVFVDVRVRLNGSVEWIEASLADVYTFRDGRAIGMRAFGDRRQALTWAGVEDSCAH